MKTDSFALQLEKLNKEQREAVETIDGPVMVIAGPGTGKTTILTLRIANILKNTDTPPSGILAITFSESGAKAMRMKLREVIGRVANEVRIHTFHGFASAIIAEFGDHFVHLARSKQISDIQAEGLIRKILKEQKFATIRPYSNPDFYLNKIIGAISDLKSETISPIDLRAFIAKERKKINSDDDSYSTRGKTKGELKATAEKHLERCDRTMLLADVYEEYEMKKLESRSIDFDDLLVELGNALKSDELLLRLLQEKFLYVLVDEHQDTNNAQNHIVRMIGDFFDNPNIFVVGDEKQAIYRFQGASVENFLAFEREWKNVKIIKLESNYRSHQSILDASFGMIENNYAVGEHQNLRSRLVAENRNTKMPIDVVSSKETDTVERYLVRELRQITKSEHAATIAIITKTNKDIERILKLLDSQDIAVSSVRSINIFEHPIGLLYFDLLNCLADPGDKESLTKTIASGLWGLSFQERTVLIPKIRTGHNVPLEELMPALGKLYKSIVDDGAVEFLIHVAEISGFMEVAVRNPSYSDVWRAIIKLAESLVHESGVEDARLLMSEMLDYKKSSENRSVKVSVGTPEMPIRVMTAHASKGLEFDYVFIPYATEESWIGRARGTYFTLPYRSTDGDDIKDARRLLYVALTRAKKHAVILYAHEDKGRSSLVPLRFIDELDHSHTKYNELTAESVESVMVRATLKHDRKRLSHFIEYTQHSLLTNGLSVTALNNFIECPSTFLFQSILKLPQAPNANAEKGTAMHFAFNAIWQSKDRSQTKTTEILKDSINAYFAQSLLPSYERISARDELLTDHKLVAKALEAHFATGDKVFTETWVESRFEAKYEASDVVIPIHGKLDVVLESEEEIRVFDYKTKQGMTEAAIRGQNKNSDGNYMRQLVFYKLLLEDTSSNKGKRITPSLVFVSPDAKGNCPIVTLPITYSDIDSVKDEIRRLIDSVWSGSFMSEKCNDVDCEWCKLKEVTYE